MRGDDSCSDRSAEEGNKLIGAWCLTDTEHNVFGSWGTSDYENCIQLKGVYYVPRGLRLPVRSGGKPVVR